jgi:hypothetical protein
MAPAAPGERALGQLAERGGEQATVVALLSKLGELRAASATAPGVVLEARVDLADGAAVHDVAGSVNVGALGSALKGSAPRFK